MSSHGTTDSWRPHYFYMSFQPVSEIHPPSLDCEWGILVEWRTSPIPVKKFQDRPYTPEEDAALGVFRGVREENRTSPYLYFVEPVLYFYGKSFVELPMRGCAHLDYWKMVSKARMIHSRKTVHDSVKKSVLAQSSRGERANPPVHDKGLVNLADLVDPLAGESNMGSRPARKSILRGWVTVLSRLERFR